ncbi:Beta-ketoadipate enol-lactone hydrolase [Actinokineospora spheciospongiae]|uniref:Beta-ketoadipate enol-lactone hydrolase n=1 Tax=Actinokineospora spheciospongiae TaxID=909613 RepID=W7J3J5_9PSEU|nr:alpha/beta hydrolase [Actinokineospora spheciospongiae]EWC63612.1 Beta-ketoadipate enol-lactone hydrolase [Actinokineospora spheciospongiae]
MADIFRTSDGVALHVVDTGPAAAPVTVVLAHGWTSDLRVWDVVEPLLAPHVRVLRYDQRGHGRSAAGPRDGSTLPRLASDLAELIADRAPSGRVVVVGHSMGGMTLMALAEAHPEVAASLAGAMFVSTSAAEMAQLTFGLPRPVVRAVLNRRSRGRSTAVGTRAVLEGMNTTGPVPAEPMPTEPIPAEPTSAEPLALAELADRVAPRVSRVQELGGLAFLRWLVFGSTFRLVDVRAVAEQLGRAHKGTMGALQRDILRNHSRVPALSVYRSVRTQVLVGEADRVTPLEHAHVIARALPDTEFVRYPKAGHMLPYERAPELAARILRLARASAPAPTR